ncbi:MAG: AAA family ATPase, partial [Pseudomonadota bacterium]
EFLQVDTTNILFICGGAFAGLDKIIKARSQESSIGFGATIQSTLDDESSMLDQVRPEDLLRYGLIPEFVGRVPVLATLEDLSRDALVSILTQPKNALIKQYRYLFSMDNVELTFTDKALEALADQAVTRKTGARGLRAVMEDILLEPMYELPGDKQVREIVINDDVITGQAKPLLIYQEPRKGIA